MKVFFASDHAGFALKNALVEHTRALGHDTEDMGAFAENPDDDYPDFVTALARAVASDATSRGVVVGGSGQGEAMAANRVRGVRAAVFYAPAHVGRTTSNMGNDDVVRLAREHNDANVLSLGARFVSEDEAREAVRIFLETPFSTSPRHARRIAKF